MSRLVLYIRFVQHSYLIPVALHIYKTPTTSNGRQKGRGDERFSFELWGVISHRLSRSLLNFSCKTPQRLHHTEYLPARKDLLLHVTSGLSQSTQAKNKLAVSPIKKPCAYQKLAFLNLQPFLFCKVNVVLVKLPECLIHYTVRSMFCRHDLQKV